MGVCTHCACPHSSSHCCRRSVIGCFKQGNSHISAFGHPTNKGTKTLPLALQHELLLLPRAIASVGRNCLQRWVVGRRDKGGGENLNGRATGRTKLFSLPRSPFASTAYSTSAENLQIKEPFNCFHSSSMDAPSVSWYRVLPKPPSLYNHEYPTQKARRDSSLLQHKIVHEPYSRHPLDGTRYRRNTLDSIPARPSRATSPDLIPLSQTTERLRIGALTRKRAASQMAVEESPRSASPASPSTNTAEPTTQFCLCQPDPKIPRPRNGK